VTPRLRDQLSDPVPLAPRWQPAGRTDVLGRWRPLGPRAGNPRAYVAFDDRGRWTGSDGCNGAGGRYAVGPAGALLTTSGASTLIGCDNSPVPAWVASARRVALDGAALVLFTGDGRVLGRLARAGSATTSSQASK
jgi:hypothetical protein